MARVFGSIVLLACVCVGVSRRLDEARVAGQRGMLRHLPSVLPTRRRKADKLASAQAGDLPASGGSVFFKSHESRLRESGFVRFTKKMNILNKVIKAPTCRAYEICQCQLGATERETACRSDSCTHAPGAWGACGFKPAKCSWGNPKKNVRWAYCEFANTLTTDMFPGEGAFAAIPAYTSAVVTRPANGHRVFTDIDDTIACSHGGLGGVLRDCKGAGTKAHGIFPGAISFQYALAQGIGSPISSATLRRAIPFTARPRELRWLIGLGDGVISKLRFWSTSSKVKRAYNAYNWSLDTKRAKYGRAFNVLDQKARFGHRGWDATDYEKTGYTKFVSFRNMYEDDRKHGEFGCAQSYFIGDNGQGDLVAAQMMRAYQGGVSGLRAAFIHDTLRKCDQVCANNWKKYGIFIFKHYAEAAAIAAEQGFISDEAKSRVCADVQREKRGSVVLECTHR